MQFVKENGPLIVLALVVLMFFGVNWNTVKGKVSTTAASNPGATPSVNA